MSVAKPIASARFSTGGFAAHERHEAWVARTWPAISPMYETTPIGEFDAASHTYFLSDLTISYSQVSPQSYRRTRKVAQGDGFDHLAFIVPWTGTAAGEVDGEPYVRAPHSLMLVDAARSEQHVSSGNDCVFVTMPRRLAEEALPAVDTLHGLIIPPKEAQLMSSTLRGLRQKLDGLDQSSAPVVQRLIVDVLSITLASVGKAGAHGGAAEADSLAFRAHRLIAQNLGSSTLTVANLGRKLGVSRATLQRAFRESGGVETFIREQRLEAVHGALSSPLERRSISALADVFGFSDGAHLSRLFRARYGLSPSDYRAVILG